MRKASLPVKAVCTFGVAPPQSRAHDVMVEGDDGKPMQASCNAQAST